MKKDKVIYWLSTGLLALMMVFSAFSYLTKPEMAAAFQHLGFPPYFRVELAVAKLLGALVLLLPVVPAHLKDWAYAGFGFTFISRFCCSSPSLDHDVSPSPGSWCSMYLITQSVSA